MEAATEKIVAVVLQYGLAGVVMLALAYVCRALWLDNKELRATMFEMGRETAKAQEATTASLNRLSDLLIRGRRPE